MNSKLKIVFGGLGVIVLLLGAYYTFVKFRSPVAGGGSMITSTTAVSTTSPVSDEDGDHNSYILRAYEKEGQRFIDVDYFQTLVGRAAVIRQLQDGDCLPEEGWTKEQLIERLNQLRGTEEEIDEAMRNIPGTFNCGPNGWWTDVNDNPKIRTFKVSLKEPIYMQYDRSGADFGNFGVHTPVHTIQSDYPEAYEISWETLKNIISGANYQVQFNLKVSLGEVVSINEIYRP